MWFLINDLIDVSRCFWSISWCVCLSLGVGCDRMRSGSVAEWLKAHDSKSCGQQCLGGSNPLASARK